MATWQFDILFVPNEASTTLPSVEKDGSFDDSSWWVGRQPSQDLNKLFGEVLPLTQSWSTDLVQFGKEDETCIQVLRETDEVSSIEARIDLRSVTIDIIERIVQIAVSLQCRFYLPERRKIIEPNLELLVTEMQQSNAAAFIENPKRFLMNLQVRNNRN
jgi:hypothetical protein